MKQSIVIVEDEGIAAEDIRRRLESWGFLVPAVVATGEDAIAAAERVHPDLVLMDVHLKGPMDGVEAARQIQSHANIPVIYATAFNDGDTIKRAQVNGPFGIINKPYDDLEIRAAIEVALTRQTFQRQLDDLETRYRMLLSTSSRKPEAGSKEAEANPLHALRRYVGSLHATELTQEQRDILDEAERSLRSLEGTVGQP